MSPQELCFPDRDGDDVQGQGMFGWVRLDREQVHDIAKILVPGIVTLGIVLLLFLRL